MQGDRDNRVEDGSRKVGVEVLEGEAKEWLFEVQLAAVFELVNRLPQGAFVTPDGAGTIEVGWSGATGATPILRTVRQGDRRPEWVSTTGAVGRCDEADQAPTTVAKSSLACRGDGPPAIIAVLR
jgi:hypothetical protein